MKKLIALVITLMTVVTLSASAQCLTATHVSNSIVPPRIYGDLTACPKTYGMYQIKTAAINAVKYRWFIPKGWGIYDGSGVNNQIVNNNQLYKKPRTGEYYETDSLRVYMSLGSTGGIISVYPVNACGQVGQPLTTTVSMTCTEGWGIDFGTNVTTLPDTTFIANVGLNIKPDPAYRTANQYVTCVYLSALPEYNGVKMTSIQAYRKTYQGAPGATIYKFGSWWSPIGYTYFGDLPYCWSNGGGSITTFYQAGQDYEIILGLSYGDPQSYVQCSTPFILDCQDPIDPSNP